MSKTTIIAIIITALVTSLVYIPAGVVLAEQSGNTPNSGVVSRIKSVYDSLVSLGHGSDSEGSLGNWGNMWNRIRSAGEWTPSGDALESEVVSGKVFYKDSRTPITGSLALTGDALASEVATGKTFYSNSFTKLTGTAPAPFDYGTQSKVIWDDGKNGENPDGDNAGEESVWTNTAGDADTGVWKDTRTGLYWSSSQGIFTNSFTVVSCNFYTSDPRGSYDGSDSDCGNSINHCANLSLDANGDGIPETNWYLPSYKELLLAHINGVYNQTNSTFSTSNGFWSHSELSGYGGWAFAVHFGGNSNVSISQDKITNPNNYRVRCVRRD